MIVVAGHAVGSPSTHKVKGDDVTFTVIALRIGVIERYSGSVAPRKMVGYGVGGS
jgi:hypothetical protein